MDHYVNILLINHALYHYFQPFPHWSRIVYICTYILYIFHIFLYIYIFFNIFSYIFFTYLSAYISVYLITAYCTCQSCIIISHSDTSYKYIPRLFYLICHLHFLVHPTLSISGPAANNHNNYSVTIINPESLITRQ